MAAYAIQVVDFGDAQQPVDIPEASEIDFESAFWPLFLIAFRTAHRVLRNRAAAEDVAADVLVKTHIRWDRFRGDDRYCSAWVIRAATNAALDIVRRRPAAWSPPESDGFEAALTSHLAVTASLASLSRRQRDVVALRYLVGLSTGEIARVLDIEEGSVRSHLARALQKLRGRLGDEFKGDLR